MRAQGNPKARVPPARTGQLSAIARGARLSRLGSPRHCRVAERDPVVHPAAVVPDRIRGVSSVEQLAHRVGSGSALRAVAEEDGWHAVVELADVVEDLLVWDRACVGDRRLAVEVGQAGVDHQLATAEVLDQLSSPIVRTPGASSIGCTVPQVASTLNRPSLSGRGIWQA